MNISWNVTNGEWAATADWSPASEPNIGDDATLANGGTLTVGPSDFSATAQTLTVTDGAVIVQGELHVDGLSVTGGASSLTVNGGELNTGFGGQGGIVFSQTADVVVENNGALSLGQYIDGAVSGTVTLESGGEYIFDDALASSTTGDIVDFAGAGGTFADQQAWSGAIKNFNASDNDALNFVGQISSESYNAATNQLTVGAGGTTYTLLFTNNQQALTTANFSNGVGGSSIHYTGQIFQQFSSANYDAASGNLTISGFNFSTTTSAYNVTALTISGEDSVSYALTNGSAVAAGPTSTSFTVNLSAADQLAVDGLLNKNGATSSDGFAFGLSATAAFETGGTASTNAAVSVSNALTPTLSTVVYDPLTGVFNLTGANLENEGTTYGINPFDFTITGQGGQTYNLSLDDDLASSSASAPFTLTATDLAQVNALLDKTGFSSQDNTTYNLSAAATWDSEVGSAITTQSIEVLCFASGTRICTARGDVAVEALQVGDLALTASGESRPIRWLGHRRVDCRRHPQPADVMPVRIAAHAFGPDKPARDLQVSPGHAICVDIVGEALIPAAALVNGATIRQLDVDEVTYWHVELDSHDIVFADNLAAESYFDTGNRAFFSESEVVNLNLTPEDAKRVHENFCRPFHEAGALVDVVRSQLLARARSLGWTLHRDPLADLHLLVDGRRVDPVVENRRVRFSVPCGAQEVWLASATARPLDVELGRDSRTLGVCLAALHIEAASALREIRLDDPTLGEGFHDVERNGETMWRWTAGRARLPAALWADEAFELTVALGGEAPPRWLAPAHERAVANASDPQAA